jgi:hypothetical protein
MKTSNCSVEGFFCLIFKTQRPLFVNEDKEYWRTSRTKYKSRTEVLKERGNLPWIEDIDILTVSSRSGIRKDLSKRVLHSTSFPVKRKFSFFEEKFVLTFVCILSFLLWEFSRLVFLGSSYLMSSSCSSSLFVLEFLHVMRMRLVFFESLSFLCPASDAFSSFYSFFPNNLINHCHERKSALTLQSSLFLSRSSLFFHDSLFHRLFPISCLPFGLSLISFSLQPNTKARRSFLYSCLLDKECLLLNFEKKKTEEPKH